MNKFKNTYIVTCGMNNDKLNEVYDKYVKASGASRAKDGRIDLPWDVIHYKNGYIDFDDICAASRFTTVGLTELTENDLEES